jgi:hypothetical protein
MVQEKKIIWKKTWFIVSALVIIAAIVFFVGWKITRPAQASVGVWQPIELTKENLPAYLSQFQPVNELPKDSEIALRVGSSEYIVTKGDVKLGKASNPEITITLPEKYFEIVGQKGWCAGVHEAQVNRDLDVSFNGSPAALGWKYRSLLKYRLCLG